MGCWNNERALKQERNVCGESQRRCAHNDAATQGNRNDMKREKRFQRRDSALLRRIVCWLAVVMRSISSQWRSWQGREMTLAARASTTIVLCAYARHNCSHNFLHYVQTSFTLIHYSYELPHCCRNVSLFNPTEKNENYSDAFKLFSG